MTPARLLAFHLICTVRGRDAYLRDLIDAERKKTDLDQREFAFAQVLAYGVVMCSGILDEEINRIANNPENIGDRLRDALRVTAYELLYLKKPDEIAVNQGIELVKTFSTRAAGFASAVLHKMAESSQMFPWGDRDTDAEARARFYGVPYWFEQVVTDQYGVETCQNILATSMETAPTYLVDIPWQEGEQFAADLSSQQIADLVPLKGPILEIGSGRGTKTMLLLKHAYEETGNFIEIHAVDDHRFKNDILHQRIKDAGLGQEEVHTFTLDARDLSSCRWLRKSYPTVFVDAPCSGTGTLRRHPEIRWRLTPQDVLDLCNLQIALLNSAAGKVAPGGTLVYSTCSILQEENDFVISTFLESEAGEGFSRVGEAFKTVPTHDGPDGHFAVLLQRG
ncbi:MAG: hypothetical protein LUD25_00980 [Coriobacteriaceae bacterium]|nr:hypothetical protein [Coriobacteriaceae bacterium]